ncbi:unnamed protein product [Lepidochelys kempii]
MQRDYIRQTWEWRSALFRVSDLLMQTWGSMGQKELESLQIKVSEINHEQDSNPVLCNRLETAEPVEVMEELIHECGQEHALRVTQDILRGMNRVALAQRLMEATRTDASRENQCELCPREKVPRTPTPIQLLPVP